MCVKAFLLRPRIKPYHKPYLQGHGREQDIRTELVRLLIEAEADPTFIPTNRWRSEDSLGSALDVLEDTVSGSPAQVIPSILKYLRLHHDSHIC
jgi:hypothetical protein